MIRICFFNAPAYYWPVLALNRERCGSIVDQLGFTLDVDYAPNDAFRVVQLTPRRHGPEPSVGGKLN